MSDFRLVPPQDLETDMDSKEKMIKDILSRGKIVRFTNAINGITKDVNEWNADSDGDLIAFRHTGLTPYICWAASQYSISELDE